MAEPQSMIVKVGESPSVHSMGAQIELLMEAEGSGGTFDLFIGTLPPGGGPPLHRHKESELLYVLDGEVTFRTGPGSSQRATVAVDRFQQAQHRMSDTHPGSLTAGMSLSSDATPSDRLVSDSA